MNRYLPYVIVIAILAVAGGIYYYSSRTSSYSTPYDEKTTETQRQAEVKSPQPVSEDNSIDAIQKELDDIMVEVEDFSDL